MSTEKNSRQWHTEPQTMKLLLPVLLLQQSLLLSSFQIPFSLNTDSFVRRKPSPGHHLALLNVDAQSSEGDSSSPTPSFATVRAATIAGKGVLLDLSPERWGIISITGEDRLQFLHNQLTNSFTGARPGQVLEASYTTPLGRTIDLVTAFILEDEVLLLASPNRHEQLLAAFEKYIFPLDRVKVTKKATSGIYTFITPSSAAAAADTAALDTVQSLLGHDTIASLPGPKRCVLSNSFLIAEGSGLAFPGYLLLSLNGTTTSTDSIVAKAKAKGIFTGGEQEWHMLRIAQGRPYPDKELTVDITPLEAGLWHTVHLEKGCYLGQEAIAKVANNKGERQKLYGIKVPSSSTSAHEGARLVDKDGKRAGVITSLLSSNTRLGLAYIRKTVGNPLMDAVYVEGEDSKVEVFDLPYATRTQEQSASGGSTTTTKEDASTKQASADAAAEKAAEAARKAKKLEEMQRRLDAFKAQQKKQ